MVSIDPEGGDVQVKVGSEGVEITAHQAGLRDLARWCLALAEDNAPAGSHVHLDPGVAPLVGVNTPLLLGRDDRLRT